MNASSASHGKAAVSGIDELETALAQQRAPADARLGEVLIGHGLLTQAQLSEALDRQTGEPTKHLGTILTEMGSVSPDDVRRALADKFAIPYLDLRKFEVPAGVLAKVPADLALQSRFLPVAYLHGRLVVAMENPLDWQVLEAIRFNTKSRVEVVMASAEDIAWAHEKYYGGLDETEALVDLEVGPVADTGVQESAQAIEKEAQKKPIVRLVNAIILQAINRKASDINIRPEAERVNVYYRIDGRMTFIRTLHRSLLPAVVSRIKITGQMNIAERRLPQDGHARMTFQGRVIDLRISVVPTVTGESVVIRVLDKDVGLKPLADLGLPTRELDLIRQLVARSFGMFLVTGPTGSGKSTTLYAILNEIKQRSPHILTVEDPVEYGMAGIEQVQIAPAQGYTFAEALRHFLRHDPDVIMVGEIRDLETAQIANKAALTGHMVLSTLHTNDAVSTITRLLDMGIEPYLVSGTLLGVLAQRLVRLNCPDCKVPVPIEPLVRQTLKVSAREVFYRGRGCTACNQTGYRGRAIVTELVVVTPELAALINNRRPAQRLKELAVQQGMVSLTQNALQIAREGRTSLDEVFSVRLD